MSRQSSTHAKPGNAPGLTRSNASLLQRQSTLGTHVCVQREAVGATTEAPAPSLVREVMESPGRPLDSTTRSAMSRVSDSTSATCVCTPMRKPPNRPEP